MSRGGPSIGQQGKSRPDVDGRVRKNLPRCMRLIPPALFEEAYSQNTRWVGAYMVLFLRRGEGANWRLGVVTGRKVGQAVDRVKARRRLREAYRQHRHLFIGPYDVVLIARRTIVDCPWDALVKDMLGIAERAGILKEKV